MTFYFQTPSDLSLISGIIGNPSQETRVIGLSGNDAQCVADYFSELLHQDGAFSSDDRKRLLSLLQRLVKSAQVLPQCYELREIRCDFSQAREGGAFADIFQGVYQKQKVCVKAVRIFQKGDNTQALKAFKKEIVLWAHLSHENILPFYGIYRGASERICIISPWVDPGDLSVYLQNFPQRSRQPLVLDVTAGLQYLHQSDIVHGDLKAKNILVSRHGRALITDFGISRIVCSTKLASTQLSSGTMRWMAPELLLDNSQNCPPVTLQSDIWSLGCLYYEIFTRKVPFYDCTNDANLFFTRVKPGAIPRRPIDEHGVDNISDDMWRLMKKCWHHEPCSRPSCEDIYASFAGTPRVHEQYSSHHVDLWKPVRSGGGLGIEAICERARHILMQPHAVPLRTMSRSFKAAEPCVTSHPRCPLPPTRATCINAIKDVRKDDTIIAFMGPTGAGKSFFIDLLTGTSEQDRRAGNILKSITSQIETTAIAHPGNKARRIVLIDTPGFGDTAKSYMQILQVISDWLQNTYKVGARLSGLIYLYRITDDRMPYNTVRLLQAICGDRFMNQVFLISTMGGKIRPEVGKTREDELKKRFWEPLFMKGSSVERLAKTESGEAWRIVNKLIESHDKKPRGGIMLLQEEMVDRGIKLNETQAAKTLYALLQKQLADQKESPTPS